MTTMVAMGKPILFSGPMVRAILEGRKTQTRRVAKFKPLHEGLNLGFSGLEADDQGVNGWALASRDGRGTWNERTELLQCPYGPAGRRLWVRETWVYRSKHDQYYYRADHPEFDPYAHDGWKPSIFMPRAACRIVLEVVNVRVERLQRITPEDAKAEGDVERSGMPEYHERGSACHVDWYRNLWNEINAKRGYGWVNNPWVWVIEFKRVT